MVDSARRPGPWALGTQSLGRVLSPGPRTPGPQGPGCLFVFRVIEVFQKLKFKSTKKKQLADENNSHEQ